MNLRTIAIAISCALLAACSTSTPPSSTSIDFSSTKLGDLTAGGFLLQAPSDTAIAFDFVPSVTVTNNTGAPITFIDNWTFGPLVNGEILDTIHVLPNGAGTRAKITLAPGASTKLGWTSTILIDTRLRPTPIGAKVTLQDASGNPATLATQIAQISPVPYDSRYHGYIYTTESSPNPLGVFDTPDDGDWQSGTAGFQPRAVYPNPADGATAWGFTIESAADSVNATLYLTPHYPVAPVISMLGMPGSHELTIPLRGLTPGLYRLNYSSTIGTQASAGHGDILVSRP